jgi:phage virion morphogenesis protein
MAGSFVSVDVLGEEAIAKALNRLLSQSEDLSPALREIGEHMLESTQNRMSKELSPDGQSWEPLSINTIENKSLSGQSDKILRGYGTLADLLNYQLNGNQLMFGSNMEYAATHQFGREKANIPARQFLGVSDSDEVEILDILRSHLVST